MRFVTRTLVFVIVILVSFWFTAENANEIVNIDIAFLRIRASLPLVIFVSLLMGMAASTLLAWRTERKARRRPPPPSELPPRDPSPDYMDAYAGRETEPLERSPLG
ncbi:MAG: hypothetical protein MJB57_07905 [Gemmatimonadetes bacterium]|nr:hypothetical protein [Gemmatimonadota bacterium]